MNSKPGSLFPTTLIEALYQQATGTGRRGKRRCAKRRAKSASRGGTAASANDLPLLEEDHLFVRVAPAAQKGCDPAEVARAFCTAFKDVWGKIPRADRQRLLAYWQRGVEGSIFVTSAGGEPPRPLIRVVSDDLSSSSQVVCLKQGHELSFPVSLVSEQQHLLAWEIGRSLAQVYRLATRAHWGLVLELIEEPLGRWECQQRARATEAKRDKKGEALEAKYLRQYQAQVAEIVRRWGLVEPTVANQREEPLCLGGSSS